MQHVLIHSPFVGPSCWRAVAKIVPDALAADYGGVSGPDWYEGAADRIVRQADDTPWIAVLHSSAGGFAPSLAAAARRLTGLIFVDSILPHLGKSAVVNAPEAQIQQLRALTTEGFIAPWNTWFDPDPTPRWIPDPTARAAFLADLPRVPFAFLEATAPDDNRWERLPAAFVQLSKGYEANAARAEQRGWPVRRAKLNHLAMVGEPAAVAELLSDLP